MGECCGLSERQGPRHDVSCCSRHLVVLVVPVTFSLCKMTTLHTRPNLQPPGIHIQLPLNYVLLSNSLC
jgi:hypothetical protein